ncbi:MAG: thiamine-phosphate kinase [Pseudomonadota bacterium]
MDEFGVIQKFFTSPITRADVVLGSGDDCALVTVPAGKQLAITTDTLIKGIHFPDTTSPYDIGYKALAVSLSDLAAMGATPAWVTGALTVPIADDVWLAEFARGLFGLATEYHVQLIGGDLTHGPALSVTIQAIGLLPTGKALTRGGARAGDLIYVTGNLGDAGLALRFLQQKISVAPEFQQEILIRLNQPTPRIAAGENLLDIASSAIDISDGLAGDLQHILKKSGVGAKVFVDKLPLSKALCHSVTTDEAIALALTAGDDYELCFTIPKAKAELLATTDFTCIGEITTEQSCIYQFTNGIKYHGNTSGYRHF